jgi:hypothetical protein
MKIYAIQFKVHDLIRLILRSDAHLEPWRESCEIIPDYMPPYPQKDTQPRVVVAFQAKGWDEPSFLRYSKGPAQGFFWDIYGDDMQTVELALVAISQAPAPRCVDPIKIQLKRL